MWSSKGSSRSKRERGKLLWVFSEAFTLPRASWIVCLHSKLYFFYYQALRSRDFHTFDGCEKQSGLQQQQQSAPSYKHVVRRIIIHTTYYQIPVLVFLTPGEKVIPNVALESVQVCLFPHSKKFFYEFSEGQIKTTKISNDVDLQFPNFWSQKDYKCKSCDKSFSIFCFKSDFCVKSFTVEIHTQISQRWDKFLTENNY